MGPGTHCDTLNDHWGAWNWRKLVGLGRHLEVKLKEALVMSSRHRATFKALSTTFPSKTIKEWTEMLERWLVDPSEPDPFEEDTISKLLLFLIANTTDTCISRNYKRQYSETACRGAGGNLKQVVVASSCYYCKRVHSDGS